MATEPRISEHGSGGRGVSQMSKYLVELAHTERECVWAVKQLLDAGPEFLARFDWGCRDGEHIGWAIVEADNKFGAQELIPPIFRFKARIVELGKFTPEEVLASHAAQV
jgi:hypothetical protein